MRLSLLSVGCWGWILALTGCATTQSGPAGFVVESGGITRAADYSRSAGEVGLIVELRGTRVHESYANGGGVSAPHHVRSITKNLTALAILAAARDGTLVLNAPAANYFEPWRGRSGYQRITIQHLLDMTGGLDGAGPAIYRQPAKNIPAAAAGARVVAQPGEAFNYGAASYEVLGALLNAELVRRGDGYEAYLQRRVLAPMGIAALDFRRDALGNPHHSAGASMTTRDLARLGRGELANHGSAHQISGPNPAYHNGIWNNRQSSSPDAVEAVIEDLIGRPPGSVDWRRVAISRNAPDDLMVMLGSRGQRVYISPSLGLVVARTGDSPSFRDADFLARLFTRL